MGLILSSIMRESLETMLRKIDREIVVVETRLRRIALRFGLSDWKELEGLFKAKGVDNSVLDMLWPEYLYLRKRLEELRKRRSGILSNLVRL